MIQLTDIHKTYKVGKTSVHALKGVSLSVKRGEIFGVIGLSGAGKSTLLRTVNALERPTSGHVIVNGVDILQLSEKELRSARKKIGMVFQHFNLLHSLNVYDNVAEILRMNKFSKQDIKQKVDELLMLVGLQDKAGKYPSQLSGGQKQRVGIARALALDPELLLCDEATSALDPQTTESILDLLLDINEKLGVTIMLITHEMDVIKKICDRVAVMEQGEIIEQGSVLDVFSNPQAITTKNFIRTIYDGAIPDKILEKFVDGSPDSEIVKISFKEDAALHPVLHSLAQRFPVVTNVLSGSMITLKGVPLGVMLLHISGEKQAIMQAIGYLEQVVHHVEVRQDAKVVKS